MKQIILLRHGDVLCNNDKRISLNHLQEWIISYNNGSIKKQFQAKNNIRTLLNSSDIIVSSMQKRSIESLKIFDKQAAFSKDIFNEPALPLCKGSFFKLKPKTYLFLLRVLWFFSYSNNCESYKQSKQRAKEASDFLIKLCTKEKSVLLCGHGLMNKLISLELSKKQWRNTKKSNNKNWDYSVFECK